MIEGVVGAAVLVILLAIFIRIGPRKCRLCGHPNSEHARLLVIPWRCRSCYYWCCLHVERRDW